MNMLMKRHIAGQLGRSAQTEAERHTLPTSNFAEVGGSVETRRRDKRHNGSIAGGFENPRSEF